MISPNDLANRASLGHIVYFVNGLAVPYWRPIWCLLWGARRRDFLYILFLYYESSSQPSSSIFLSSEDVDEIVNFVQLSLVSRIMAYQDLAIDSFRHLGATEKVIQCDLWERGNRRHLAHKKPPLFEHSKSKRKEWTNDRIKIYSAFVESNFLTFPIRFLNILRSICTLW